MAEVIHHKNNSLVCAAMSDVGMRRANNQDSQAIVLADDPESWRDRGHLFIVADGMGAHAAGELASRLAVENISHNYLKFRELSRPEALERAIQETNTLVHKRGQANVDFHNMGTTVSTLVLAPQGALVGHAGDSRVYRLRGDRLDQLTFDHSLVWEMRAIGQLPENTDFARSIPKNVITRSLGPNATLQVDLEGPHPIQVGDIFLLCSDGLTGQVTDEEIGPLLANLEPADAVQVLVDLANLRGGPDNTTVIIVKVTGDSLATAADGTKTARKKAAGGPALPPVVWVIFGVFSLAALVLLLADNWIAALLAAIVGAGTLVAGLARHLIAGGNEAARSAPQQYGKGPYQSVPCSAGAKFVETLRGIIDQLREAAAERDWEIDMEKLDGFMRSADQATSQKRYSEAVRHCADGVRFMMQEVRNQHKRKASDSAIDY